MAPRPIPKPRPKFKISRRCGQFRLEFPKEKAELNRIKTLAERGLVSIEMQSPPMIDQRGNVRIYLEYTTKELLSEPEQLEARERELRDLQQQLKTGAYSGEAPAPASSAPRHTNSFSLMPDEEELLQPLENDDDDLGG